MKDNQYKFQKPDSTKQDSPVKQDPFNDPRLALLENISNIVGANLDVKKLLFLILDAAAPVINAEASSLLLVSSDRKKLYFEAATGPKCDEVRHFEVDMGSGIAGWVAENGQPLLVADVHKDKRWSKTVSDAVAFEARSIACAPMKHENEVIGVMQMVNKADKKPFDERDLALLSAYTKVAAVVISRTKSFQNITRENIGLKKALSPKGRIVGESESLTKVINNALKSARTDSTVLITGESGTGKELFARLLHDNGKRCKGPFIVVNCAAIPENLIESEFFGHEKGSFTGALSRQLGKFELADGGTLFLDEIGDMPIGLQVKLLRVLEESEIQRVGGQEPLKIDVRVISATNRDLKESIAAGQFRKDLYYRLNVVNLHLPPLRERKEDIPLLLEFLINKYNKELHKNFVDISNEALSCLIAHEWKGNIRELQNLIDRIITLEDGPTILPEHLPSELRNCDLKMESEAGMSGDLKEALTVFKKDFINKTLESVDGNKTKAAKILNVQRSYLSRMVKELGIE
ncbi:MAG: sigma-54-dependent Fis family transcriptional regulator [Proteobacteria bacterium]|nr:sigma-54-dependent Fis family transcriptional regulator [Pseudomonadota bacterium]